MDIYHKIDRQTLRRLVELLPPGRARRRYERMLEEREGRTANLLRDLVLKEAELILLKAWLANGSQMDLCLESEIHNLERETVQLKRRISEARENNS